MRPSITSPASTAPTSLLAEAPDVARRILRPACRLASLQGAETIGALLRRRLSRSHVEARSRFDSPLIVDIDGRVQAITDDRTAHLSDYSHEGVRTSRNAPNGFYVASTMPEAAHEAIQGTLPTENVRRAALLSDGAARLVERFGLLDWRELLNLLTVSGPDELIRRTRRAEAAETDADQFRRRGKQHDDATAVLITQLDDKQRARPGSAARP